MNLRNYPKYGAKNKEDWTQWQSISDLWGKINGFKINVTGVPEEEEAVETVFEEVVAERCPHLMKIANREAHKLQIE